MRSVQEQPDLPPLTTEAANPVAIRKAQLSRSDANMLGGLNLASADSDKIPTLIRDALQSNLTRVIDLFRQFDDDASGLLGSQV